GDNLSEWQRDGEPASVADGDAFARKHQFELASVGNQLCAAGSGWNIVAVVDVVECADGFYDHQQRSGGDAADKRDDEVLSAAEVAQPFQAAVSPTFQSARLGKFQPVAGWKACETAGKNACATWRVR